MELNKIYQGDVLEVLKTFPNECVDIVMTSPPYWGLRDYGTAKGEGGDANCDHIDDDLHKTSTYKIADDQREEKSKLIFGNQFRDVCGKCGAKRIDNQIGLEPTPEQYVAQMVEVFREVKRVLKKQGTVWLNLGDSYAGSMKGSNGCGGFSVKSELQLGNVGSFVQPPDWKIVGLKPKDLVGIPWRVAFALQADGWYLRQDIIWHKPNPMPESVTDRCTKSHEYIFLLAKSQHYYYDNEAIKESATQNRWAGHEPMNPQNSKGDVNGLNRERDMMPESRNKRSVWTITTKPFSEAHFATFPEELCEIPIKAGSSEKGVCPECGKAWVRVVENEQRYDHTTTAKGKSDIGPYKNQIGNGEGTHDIRHGVYSDTKTLGWQPTCQCNKQPIPAVVMDIFSGAGTTSVVAKRLGRNYIGIELNPEYVKMSEQRLMLVGKEEVTTLKEFRKAIKEHKPLTEYMTSLSIQQSEDIPQKKE